MNTLKKHNLRKITTGDIIKVSDLIYKTVDISYSPVYPQEAICYFKSEHSVAQIQKKMMDSYRIVCEFEGEIVATGCLDSDYIGGVYVSPQHQGMGFGKLIMADLLAKAKANGFARINLHASLPSKKFYDSLGFKTVCATHTDFENNARMDYFDMEMEL